MELGSDVLVKKNGNDSGIKGIKWHNSIITRLNFAQKCKAHLHHSKVGWQTLALAGSISTCLMLIYSLDLNP